jgi:predicted extracellular nuclease
MRAARAALASVLLFGSFAARAQVEITEWMYSGPGGEFIELTNLGPAPVDLTGWVYDDDSRFNSVAAGGLDLSAFGVLAAGESVVLTESSAPAFRAEWNLPATLKVIGGYTNNLGRSDEINLFDGDGMLVDRLTYSDVNVPGTVRTQDRSGTPLTLADLAPQTVTTGWVLAAAGDSFGSYLSAGGAVGNPGQFALAIPEPASVALWLAGLAGVAAAARRGQAGGAR